RDSLCQQSFEILHLGREVLDALVSCPNDLSECCLELDKILGLGVQLDLDPGVEVAMLAFALAVHLHSIAMALLGVGLDDSRYELALRHVISDRNFDRCELSCRSRNRIHHPSAAADQNSFAGYACGNTADDAPGDCCSNSQ